MLKFLMENAGVSAYLAGAFSIVAFLALFIMFAGVGIFGPINDALSIFQMLFLVPVFLVVYQLLRGRAPALMLALTIAAVLALLVIAFLQVLLVVRQVRFEQTIRPILYVGFALAAWWVAVGTLSLGKSSLPGGLAWAAVATGVSYAAIAAGYLAAGPQHPLTAVGFLVGAVSTPVWCIWMGRMLTSGQLIALGST